MSFLSKIESTLGKAAGLFIRLFTSGQAQRDLDLIADLIPRAMPIVQLVATLTPTPADDALIAFFSEHALPYVNQYLALPPDRRGRALLDAATLMLGRVAPSGIARRIVDAAVQMAYVKFRAEQGYVDSGMPVPRQIPV